MQAFPTKFLLKATILSSVIFPISSYATVSFTGVAAGDATNNSAIVWTRAVDGAAPVKLTLRLGTDPATLAKSTLTIQDLVADASKDFTAKVALTGLEAGTVYYYQFVGPANELSIVGRFKTAPLQTATAAVRFAFSGDMDGLMRPYALASTIPAQQKTSA